MCDATATSSITSAIPAEWPLRNFLLGQWDLRRKLLQNNGQALGWATGHARFVPLSEALGTMTLECGTEISLKDLEHIYREQGGTWRFHGCLFYHERCELVLAAMRSAGPTISVRSYLFLFQPPSPNNQGAVADEWQVEVRFWQPRDPKEHLKHFYTMSLRSNMSSSSVPSSWTSSSTVATECNCASSPANLGSANSLKGPRSGKAEHLCVKDLYKIHTEISSSACFTMRWDVTGPNKDYFIHNTFSRAFNKL